jgi:hypothetical protein
VPVPWDVDTTRADAGSPPSNQRDCAGRRKRTRDARVARADLRLAPDVTAGALLPAPHRHSEKSLALRRDLDHAANLGNPWRRLVPPRRIDSWSLTSLQQRLVKTGGRLVKHACYYWLLLAESHLTRRLFGAMLRRIWALPVPTG